MAPPIVPHVKLKAFIVNNYHNLGSPIAKAASHLVAVSFQACRGILYIHLPEWATVDLHTGALCVILDIFKGLP